MDKTMLDKGLLDNIEKRSAKRGMTVDEYLSTANTRYGIMSSLGPVLEGEFTNVSYAVFDTEEDALDCKMERGNKYFDKVTTEDEIIAYLIKTRKPIFTPQQAALRYGLRREVMKENNDTQTVILSY